MLLLPSRSFLIEEMRPELGLVRSSFEVRMRLKFPLNVKRFLLWKHLFFRFLVELLIFLLVTFWSFKRFSYLYVSMTRYPRKVNKRRNEFLYWAKDSRILIHDHLVPWAWTEYHSAEGEMPTSWQAEKRPRKQNSKTQNQLSPVRHCLPNF